MFGSVSVLFYWEYVRFHYNSLTAGLVTSDHEFVEVVRMLLPESGYVYCPGISVVAYRDFFEVLHYLARRCTALLSHLLRDTRLIIAFCGTNQRTRGQKCAIQCMTLVIPAKRYISYYFALRW